MTQQNTRIRIGITQGDINGVGPELIVKVLSNPDILELFTPVVFGDSAIMSQTARQLNQDVLQFEVIPDASHVADGRINLIEVGDHAALQTPGVPSEEGGKAAVAALEAASKAIHNGDLDLIVTAPIDKNTAQSEDFRFSGHTEYFEDKFVVEGGKALMILANANLRVALVTTHLPLAKVPEHITKEIVMRSIRGFNSALKMDFGCERPKIAVLSLNPHCGDGGLIGREEIEEIIPAISECRKEGIMAFGPIAADGFFGSAAYVNFDGVLAMYHDQGLAPFKALAGAGGVNFTAGLNIVRTSPDHGTAYDKAGKGVADETSMREAIYAAIDIARRRDSYLEASENPLPIRVPEPRGKRQQKEKDAAEQAEITSNEE